MSEHTEHAGPEIPALALRAKQAAAALSIGTRKLWVLTNQGRIPHLRVDGMVLYSVDALRAWLNEQVKP